MRIRHYLREENELYLIDMENSIEQRLAAQEEKINAIYVSVEKTRKYLLIIMWSTVAMVVLPLLAGALIVPYVISSFSSYYGGLGSF